MPSLSVPPRIIDCFTYNGERDLLAARLQYLGDLVDYFVIVESDQTFAGEPKPMWFANTCAQFACWMDKIIYVPAPVDNITMCTLRNLRESDFTRASWLLETTQRNCITRGLQTMRPHDIVMVGDVDEIPSRDHLYELSDYLRRDGKLPYAAHALQQHMMYYNMKQTATQHWVGTVVSTVDFVRQQTPQWVRDNRGTMPRKDGMAGFHLSYWMTPEDVQKKIKSFSHQELNTPEFTDINHIRECMRHGVDLFGREENSLGPCDIRTIADVRFIQCFSALNDCLTAAQNVVD